MRRLWRAIFFQDDDDRTPQGKLTHGCFYVFYLFLLFLFIFGAVVPTIDWACGGCWSEARKQRPWQ